MSEIKELIERLCPDGVEYKKLGEVCEIKGRIGFRGYTRQDLVGENDGAISLSPSNIINGNLMFDKCTYVSWEKYKESPEIMAQEGDIVFTKTASVGKTALIKMLPKEATINPQLVLLKQIKCNNAFLSYILKGDRFQNEVRKITGVGSVPNVPQSSLAEIEIPVPPIEVQRKIVEILDNFTELEAELERKLEAELEARQKQYEYYRNQLLTFDDTRSDVKWMTLGEIGKCYSGATPKTGIAKYWDNGTISWMNSGEVNLGRVFKTEKKITQEGYNSCSTKMVPVHTVVIALAGQGKTRGTVAITEIELCTNQSLCAIELKKDVMDSYFLLHYLRGQYQTLRKISSGDGTRGGLNQNMIRSFIVPVPPLEEQKRIVSILDRFEALTTDLQSGLPAEIEARRKQYEYYREKLLTFKRKTA